jgi:hypothetical protein
MNMSLLHYEGPVKTLLEEIKNFTKLGCNILKIMSDNQEDWETYTDLLNKELHVWFVLLRLANAFCRERSPPTDSTRVFRTRDRFLVKMLFSFRKLLPLLFARSPAEHRRVHVRARAPQPAHVGERLVLFIT